jgi:uncharacterized membrane protein
MKISNPFQMNDWEIRKFLKTVLCIQFAVWGIIGLETIGLQILFLREIICFIYLLFIPGYLILRILRLHKLGNIESILYAVGLSIATLMFTGFFMNIIFPIFNILKIISTIPLLITISLIFIILSTISYFRDRDFADPNFIDISSVFSPTVLLLGLIPLLSILGVYLFNFYHTNILIIVLIFLLALIVLLIAFDKIIPNNLYPLAVFIIAISLLYHRSLISMFIWGWDIFSEYYFSNLVIINSQWNSTIPSGVNGMLSISMLAPIISKISNISLIWVFKIIYPFLFSLVPLGLYRIFQKQTNDKISFLSCFFFVSLFTFYGEMLSLARQQIAELFLVLLILLMINKILDRFKKSFLFIIFGFSLVVSHYGLSYIYIFLLVGVWLILFLVNNPQLKGSRDKLQSIFIKLKRTNLSRNRIFLKTNDWAITSTFVILFVVFAITWYIYISGSQMLDSFISVGNHIVSSIYSEFLDPDAAQGLGMILSESPTQLQNMGRYLGRVAQFFIIVGILSLLFKKTGMKFGREYKLASLLSFFICLGGITLPYFASALNSTRLYQITLIFLAPFCVIGGITFFKIISRLIKSSWTDVSINRSIKVLSVFFVFFLFFNSGLISEVVKDEPLSISLNSEMDFSRFNNQEVLGAMWLNNSNSSNIIYSDAYRKLLLMGFVLNPISSFPFNAGQLQEISYIYLGSLNINKNKAKIGIEYSDTNDIFNNRDKIYSNAGSEVYYSR